MTTLQERLDYLKDKCQARLSSLEPAVQMSPGIDREYEILDKLCKDLKRLEQVDAEIEAAKFWPNIVYPDGASAEEVQAELIDYAMILENVGKVYCHVTGNRISKASTFAYEVISVVDEHIENLVDELSKEKLEEERSISRWNADVARQITDFYRDKIKEARSVLAPMGPFTSSEQYDVWEKAYDLLGGPDGDHVKDYDALENILERTTVTVSHPRSLFLDYLLLEENLKLAKEQLRKLKENENNEPATERNTSDHS